MQLKQGNYIAELVDNQNSVNWPKKNRDRRKYFKFFFPKYCICGNSAEISEQPVYINLFL